MEQLKPNIIYYKQYSSAYSGGFPFKFFSPSSSCLSLLYRRNYSEVKELIKDVVLTRAKHRKPRQTL